VSVLGCAAVMVLVAFSTGATASTIGSRTYPPTRARPCEIGFHIGPAGTCVLGLASPTSEAPPPPDLQFNSSVSGDDKQPAQ
jgi:hypothetical protein